MQYATLRTHWRAFSAATILVLLATALPLSLFTPSPALGDSTWVVTSLADDGGEDTLRYAVDNSEDGDTIRFDPSLRGTITLDYELGQLILDHPLTIMGPGASRLTISGDNETRVLFMKGPKHHDEPCPNLDPEGDDAAESGCCSGGGGCCAGGGGCDSLDPEAIWSGPPEYVEDPDFVISGLTIRDGFPKYEEPFPCIPNDPLKPAHGPGCYGGNVLCVRTSVALIDCVIRNGFAEQGGGVAARNEASLLLQGCTVYANEAGDTGTEFTKNGEGWQDTSNGGGGIDIRNHTAVRMQDCSVHDNIALAAGGGVSAGNNTDLEMEGCDIIDNTAEEGGGIAARSGGAEYGDSLSTSVSLTSCQISGNEVNLVEETTTAVEIEPGGEYNGCGTNLFYSGGGIYAKKIVLLLEDCTIENNTVNDDDEKPGAGGGIMLKRSKATISGCTISGNKAGTGMSGGFAGGIASLNSDTQILTCSIVGNSAGDGSNVGVGAGIYVGQGQLGDIKCSEIEADPEGQNGNTFLVEISESLIADNTAGSTTTTFAAGGGVCSGNYELIEFALPRGSVEPGDGDTLDFKLTTVLTNCTISGNAAVNNDDTAYGAGVGCTGNKRIGLNFCTVTENSSTFGSGLAAGTRVARETAPESGSYPVIQVKNSIVAGNPCGEGCSEILGQIWSWGGNVMFDDSDFFEPEPGECYNGGCGDIIIAGDPLLGPLADNGGPTMTHALLAGSPAIDAACNSMAVVLIFDDPDEPGAVTSVDLTRDQCGNCRSFDGDGDGEARADAGAYECQPDIDVPDASRGSISGGQATVGDCEEIPVLVTNEGAGALTISDILILGSDEFSIVGDYSGTILQGGESLWVTVRFCPESPRVRSATLHIVSNDPDEAPLDIPITGTGVAERDTSVEPAQMTTNYLVVDPQQVLAGQQVTISANICNGGGEDGSQTASLAVNGVAEQSQNATVSPGACKQVTFTVAKAVPGTYSVSINGMQGQFSVLAPRLVQASVPSQQDNGLGTAGIIAIVAVVLALIAALVFIFKQT
ncbi:MAG: hypothetical protein JW846_07630 [Dehalococcoidia bacterium]|nr:hypothetical protein [Dehalococcoidia bacterium]